LICKGYFRRWLTRRADLPNTSAENDEGAPFAAARLRISIFCNEEALTRWTKM
jgi:hypothetical protein